MPSLHPFARLVDAGLEATVVLSFSRIGHTVRRGLTDWTPVEELPGAGRRVLITGANSGLGYATAAAVLRAGGDVHAVVRSERKGADTVARLSDDLGTDVGDRVAVEVADLGDLASVRALAGRLHDDDVHLDAMVHNAGAMFAERGTTGDGLERTYQLHVVAPFLLTALLLPRLAADAPTRVVTVTSGGMYAERLDVDVIDSPRDYAPATAYARAKRAQVALTGEWARRFGGHGVGFHVAHPGWALTPGVESSLPRFRQVMGPILRDPDQGADTVAWLCLADADELGEGRLWHDRHPRSPHRVPWTPTSRAEVERLWDRVRGDAGVDPTVRPRSLP